MAEEVTREIVHDRRGASAVLTWLAIILSIVAILIAVMAYNRNGDSLTGDVKENTNEAIDDAQGQ